MIKKYIRSEFLKNVATLMTGTALAQAVPLLISPILSRIYSPEDFGIFAIFMMLSALIGIIATARYELAIILPKSDKEAKNLFALSLMLTIIIASLTLILISIFKNDILILLKAPEMGNYVYLVPLMVLFMGLYQTLNNWSIRKKSFQNNAISRVSQTTSMSATQLLLGITALKPIGLIIGQILGQLIASLVLVIRLVKNPNQFFKGVTINGIINNARKYRNFLKINTPHAFVDNLKEQGTVYILIAFFTQKILGSYNFAYRIINAPSGLIGNAMYQVFYQKASVAKEENIKLQPIVLKFYKNLFLIGLPIYGILFFFAPDIFAFVFGEKWRIAGEISSIISPWLFLKFMAMPVSCLTVVLNKQSQAFLITITEIILKFAALIYGGTTGDYKTAFIFMSVSCALVMIFALYWYHRIAGMSLNKDIY